MINVGELLAISHVLSNYYQIFEKRTVVLLHLKVAAKCVKQINFTICTIQRISIAYETLGTQLFVSITLQASH